MKHETVIPNYKVMFESSLTLLALVASGWLLIKLVSACFWLPAFLKKCQIEEDAKRMLLLQQQQQEEISSDSDKSKEDFEKITESEVENQDADSKKDK